MEITKAQERQETEKNGGRCPERVPGWQPCDWGLTPIETRCIVSNMGNTNTATKSRTAKLTVKGLQRWATANRSAALAVVRAQAFATTERARVDAYIAPVFARFTFADDETGAAITDPRRLYRCDDETQVAAYFAACDVAHREHGFTGEPGTCPALVADDMQRRAENALLDSLAAFTGTSDVGFCRSLELRAKAIDLALATALASETSAGLRIAL